MYSKNVLAGAYAIEKVFGRWAACQLGSVNNLDYLDPLLSECVPQRRPRNLVFRCEQQFQEFLDDPSPCFEGLQAFVKVSRNAGATMVLTASELFAITEDQLLPSGQGEWVNQLLEMKEVVEPRRLLDANDEFCLHTVSTDNTHVYRMIRSNLHNNDIAGLFYGRTPRVKPAPAVVFKGLEDGIDCSGAGAGVIVYNDMDLDPSSIHFWGGNVLSELDLPEGEWHGLLYPYMTGVYHECVTANGIRFPAKKKASRVHETPFDVSMAADVQRNRSKQEEGPKC